MKILFFSLLIASANSLSITCNFDYGWWQIFNTAYTCEVTEVNFDGDSRNVVSVNGNHLAGRSNADVVMVSFSSFNCPKFNLKEVPQGLEKFFPNFVGLSLYTCDIETLRGDELTNYANLRSFSIAYSKLAVIPGNLFKPTPRLIMAYFSYNQITQVGEGLFDGLNYLAQIHFGMNVCINRWATWAGAIPDVVNDLKLNCKYQSIATEAPDHCGSFAKYNGGDLSAVGFQGGVNFDGTPEFVGYGDNTECDQIPSSGYISTGTSLYGARGAGAYLSCGAGISFDNINAHYLINNSKLQWKPANTTSMFGLSNVVQIDSNNGLKFAFGRIHFQGEYRVGKLHFDAVNAGLYVQLADGGEEGFENSFEVLTC